MAQLKSTNITGNLSVTGNVLASKIIKFGGTRDYVLLANGDTKPLSEFGIGSGGNLDLSGYVQGSGTVNAIPYFSAANTIASSIMIQSDGKINIIGATGSSDNEFPLELRSAYAGQSGIKFTDKNNTRLGYLFFNGRNPSVYQDNGTWAGPYKLWHEGNDGASSGLDADKLDGQEGTYYLDYNNFTNKPTLFSGDYNDLTNKPTIPSLSGYATESWVNTQLSGYSTFSGSYNDLTNKPSLNFLKYYDSNSYSVNIDTVNTASYLATVSASSGWYNPAGTKPSGMDNAFGVLHVHEHGGNYAMQLGFGGTTNKLYMRNAYNSSTFGAWRIVATEDWTGSYGNYAKWDYNSSTDCVELVWR